MSNLGQIAEDQGELVVYDPGPPVVPITGPTSVKTGLSVHVDRIDQRIHHRLEKPNLSDFCSRGLQWPNTVP